jgi:ABC-type transport system involved in cytochrome bd biosynthesis fused ATPase/permease subunit
MSKNTKIIIGVVVILAVCGFVAGFAILGMSGLYLASSSSESSSQYFTVNEVMSKDSVVNKQIRISGAVIGDSIELEN